MIAAFSLNDDGPTTRFLNEDIGTTAAYEHLACLLTSRLPTSAQQAQHLAQSDVQCVFVRGTRHDGLLLQWGTQRIVLLADRSMQNDR